MRLFGRKKEGGETGKTFKCQYCDMKFDDKERMKRHMRKAHSEKGGGDMPNTNPFGFG
ncbi:MAG TPA: C2H2-type zinc finger protein [Nitrososphaera sp.]|nr:C2H2-type zinc finger protein [Nitrososphaera sp.]